MFKLSNICEPTFTKTHARDLTIKPAVTCSDNATLPRPSFPTVPNVPIEAVFIEKSYSPPSSGIFTTSIFQAVAKIWREEADDEREFGCRDGTRVVNDNFFNYRDNDNVMRIIVIAMTITRQLKIIAITINYRFIGDNDKLSVYRR